MSERKQLSGMDWVGVGLFAVGATGAVLMCLAMGTSGPLEGQGPLGPFAAVWKDTLGVYPSLFLNAAIAFLGARLFLQGGSRTLVRNLIGCAGLALALSVIFGAILPDAGGAVGHRTGAVITAMTHIAVGALVGLIALFAVAWFAWLRAPNLEGAVSEPVAVPALEPAIKPLAKATTRPVVHKTTAVDEGVTPAESAALFPAETESVVARRLSPEEIARAPIPPSPYPEDVRRKGQVPPGARPLESRTVTAPSPNVYRWTAPLADDAPEEPSVPPIAAGLDTGVEDHPVAFQRSRAAAAEPLDVDEEDVVTDEDVRPAFARTAPALPTASWEAEQPTLFRPEQGDEEPVDAYGTPLTLVEKLRQARRESGLERVPEAVPVFEGDVTGATEHDLFDDEEAPTRESVAPRGEEAVAVQAAIPRELDAPPFAVTRASLELAQSDADALEEAEFDADDLAGDDVEGGDLEDSAEEFDDEFEVAAEGPADGFEETELEEVELIALDDEPVLEPLIVPAVLTEVGEPESTAPGTSRKHAAQRAEKLQSSLFDAVEPAAPAHAGRAATEAQAPSVPASTEREVVLQPQAAAPSERSAKTPVAPPAGDRRVALLTEIGCLFIERGRVAVSMLQRQYEMDFDDACKVLDDLQEMGLIGPYLGGQRRDILLTREQWLERVSQASAAR